MRNKHPRCCHGNNLAQYEEIIVCDYRPEPSNALDKAAWQFLKKDGPSPCKMAWHSGCLTALANYANPCCKHWLRDEAAARLVPNISDVEPAIARRWRQRVETLNKSKADA